MGLVHGFCQKLRFFHRLFLCEMDGEKVFGEVLERKRNVFQGYKILDLRKPPNLHFFNGVSPWFLLKKMTFFNYCFLLNMHFFKGVSPLFLSKTEIFPFFYGKRFEKKCLVKF